MTEPPEAGGQTPEGNDPATIDDSVEAVLWRQVKGPDPAEWGDLDSDDQALEQAGPLRLQVDEIRNEGTDQEIKGPGPQWSELIEAEGVSQ